MRLQVIHMWNFQLVLLLCCSRSSHVSRMWNNYNFTCQAPPKKALMDRASTTPLLSLSPLIFMWTLLTGETCTCACSHGHWWTDGHTPKQAPGSHTPMSYYLNIISIITGMWDEENFQRGPDSKLRVTHGLLWSKLFSFDSVLQLANYVSIWSLFYV